MDDLKLNLAVLLLLSTANRTPIFLRQSAPEGPVLNAAGLQAHPVDRDQWVDPEHAVAWSD
jgi:hypothetical protein